MLNVTAAHYAVQQVASQEFELLTITDICGNGFQIFWGVWDVVEFSVSHY